jgi:putative glycerol kinase 5
MSGESDFAQHKFILAVDVGTTVIKAHVYNDEAKVIGEAFQSVQLLYPGRGRVEIVPDLLWTAFTHVIREAVKSSGIKPSQIESIGLSTLRNSFTIWNKSTGIHYHNIITWKDNRSSKLCQEWNDSLLFKTVNRTGKWLYRLTRRTTFLAMSIFKLSTQMVASKLVWVLNEYPNIREEAESGDVLYGTLDTWLIWKMTNETVHATDPSNACISGLYDPFTLAWSPWILKLFNIPASILPEVRDTNGGFGCLKDEELGEIPIGAVIGDQQAAVFGECCFDVGDAKATLGTGTFININTGSKAHANFEGVYPLVGWKLKEQEPTYLAEGCSSDTGATIVWAKKVDLFDEAKNLTNIDTAVESNGGVYFIPAFSGLQAPYADSTATTAFIGITPETSKAHMIRSVLESVAFRMRQLYSITRDECYDCPMTKLYVDGGVANNDFIVQMTADLIGKEVDRDNHREMSSRGAAFLAGLYAGIWKDPHELKKYMSHEKVFFPRTTHGEKAEKEYQKWNEAALRCLKWYEHH